MDGTAPPYIGPLTASYSWVALARLPALRSLAVWLDFDAVSLQRHGAGPLVGEEAGIRRRFDARNRGPATTAPIVCVAVSTNLEAADGGGGGGGGDGTQPQGAADSWFASRRRGRARFAPAWLPGYVRDRDVEAPEAPAPLALPFVAGPPLWLDVRLLVRAIAACISERCAYGTSFHVTWRRVGSRAGRRPLTGTATAMYGY